MKKTILTLTACLLGCSAAWCRKPDSVRINNRFDIVAENPCRLRQFLNEMPKGGDLHTHLTGAAYAETYFDIACRDSLWLDPHSGRLAPTPDSSATVRLTPDMPDRPAYRTALIDKWSVRNYRSSCQTLPPDEHFFATFGLFSAAADNHLAELLRELRRRAVQENVLYLELMPLSANLYADKIDSICGAGFFDRNNARLRQAIGPDARPEKTDALLAELFDLWENSAAMQECIDRYVATIDSLDTRSAEGLAATPLCRYQGYADRNAEPLEVYAMLYAAYKGCLKPESKLVGVNILSPENGETALADYTGHMRMFRFLDEATGGTVRTSLHAGELTLALVQPEELRDHIRQAVLTAGADRIGHGTDIAYETESCALLDTMRGRQTVVEINLASNEFILGVQGDEHPFPLYRQAGVPTVLATDDAGVLRTDLTQQYMMAVERYGLDYYDLKQLVRNSIRYGFLPEEEKRMLMCRLEEAFAEFERTWSAQLDTAPAADRRSARSRR